MAYPQAVHNMLGVCVKLALDVEVSAATLILSFRRHAIPSEEDVRDQA
jgi:hypothetical protein